MFELRRTLPYLVSCALVLSLVACGGDGGGSVPPTAPPTPPPPPPPPAVVSQGVGLALEAGFTGRVIVTTTQAGTLKATVDWTFDENDIDVGIFAGDCSFDQFVGGQCEMVAASASTTAKPERIEGAASAGTYTLFIVNIGPGDETLSYQVVLTPDATAASSASRSKLQWRLKVPPRGFIELR